MPSMQNYLRMKNKGIIILALLMGSMFGASAQNLQDVEAMMKAAQWVEAGQALDYLIATSKAGNIGQLNMLAAECAINQYDDAAAINYLEKAAKRGVAEAYLQLGAMAMRDYDFNRAKEQYAKYVAAKEKAGKDASAGKKAIENAMSGMDMLDRVEKITVIDEVALPLDDFLEQIIVSPETGKFFMEQGKPGFLSADSRLRYTTAPYTAEDSTEYTRIYEQTRLLTGEYDQPQPILEESMQATYPFMMPDGCTFYFSSESERGLGGLDIFRSNRDSETGEFMGAVNMGMPYNSPYNDYMLAIDEYLGIGWLVSDRGHNGDGKVSAFIFIPNEARVNYEPDTEDLVALARLDDPNFTRAASGGYDEKLEEIERLRNALPHKTPALSFTMPDGEVITEFKTESARTAVKQYLTAQTSLETAEEALRRLRLDYADTKAPYTAEQILKDEKALEQQRADVRRLRQKAIEEINH